MATKKTTIRPGYGGMPAKNINAPSPMFPVKRPTSTFSKIPGGK